MRWAARTSVGRATCWHRHRSTRRHPSPSPFARSDGRYPQLLTTLPDGRCGATRFEDLDLDDVDGGLPHTIYATLPEPKDLSGITDSEGDQCLYRGRPRHRAVAAVIRLGGAPAGRLRQIADLRGRREFADTRRTLQCCAPATRAHPTRALLADQWHGTLSVGLTRDVDTLLPSQPT